MILGFIGKECDLIVCEVGIFEPGCVHRELYGVHPTAMNTCQCGAYFVSDLDPFLRELPTNYWPRGDHRGAAHTYQWAATAMVQATGQITLDPMGEVAAWGNERGKTMSAERVEILRLFVQERCSEAVPKFEQLYGCPVDIVDDSESPSAGSRQLFQRIDTLYRHNEAEDVESEQ